MLDTVPVGRAPATPGQLLCQRCLSTHQQTWRVRPWVSHAAIGGSRLPDDHEPVLQAHRSTPIRFLVMVVIKVHISVVSCAQRPGVEDFLKTMSQFYEVVVYTNQLPTYADPILDRLDPQHYVAYRCGAV